MASGRRAGCHLSGACYSSVHRTCFGGKAITFRIIRTLDKFSNIANNKAKSKRWIPREYDKVKRTVVAKC